MYVELHCHSAFSFLDGASMPGELVAQAKALGYRALALTDHNGLYGSMTFAGEAKDEGLQPITGAEVTLTDGSHVTLLVETAEGYAGLCRLLSEAHLNHPRGKPAVRPEHIVEYGKGLILLTGCRQGQVAAMVDSDRLDDARSVVGFYTEGLGRDQVWVELQQNFVRGDTERIRKLVALARHVGVGIVATNNVHYHVRQRHRLHDVLTALRHKTTLDGAHKWRRANAEFYLKSPQQMARLFASLPEALQATVRIAARCEAFDLTANLGYTFPDFENTPLDAVAEAAERPNVGHGAFGGRRVPTTSDGTDAFQRDISAVQSISGSRADRRLREVCQPLLEARYKLESPDVRAKAARRLEQELALIQRHGLSGFFLVYRDLLLLAEKVAASLRQPGAAREAANLPPGRGRGSSVSSLVCYLIGLSHVDPVKNNLSIERFLNDHLVTVPDIDLDFSRDIREELIRKVYEKYGWEHAALVCSFSTYRLRSAVRDIGKVLGLPADEVDRLARMSDRGSSTDLADVMATLPDFQEKMKEPLWQHLIELAYDISGFPRHISQHVGGMVISSRPLTTLVPLEKAGIPGRVICQWDKDACEDAGFVKVDFLSLGMLSLVEEAVEHIAPQRRRQRLPPLDLSRIPMDDVAVYDSISEGDTIGLFQIESRAQIQILPRLRPRNLDDLAITIALIRPGPIIGGAVHPYIQRRMAQREAMRRGEAYDPPYDHPLLKPVLEETLGVILYQDHVLLTAVALAGFTPGEAERFRRILGRKHAASQIESFYTKFMEGTRARGVDDAVAEGVFTKLLAFSGFGFPKSHAYAFAVLAYQSAWLRYYYPAAYAAAIFNNQPMGFYPPHVLVRDMERRGVTVLPPDVNESEVKCHIEGGKVRMGLAYVKGIGARDAAAIVARRSKAPFASLTQFVQRTGLPTAKAERLIKADAFRSLGLNRRDALWQLRFIFSPESLGAVTAERNSENSASRRESAQQMALPLAYTGAEAPLPEMTPWEDILTDFGTTGVSVREHLMHVLRPELTRPAVTATSLNQRKSGTVVFLAGLVTTRQRPSTAKGVLFLLVEDETGMVNVIVRPSLYERQKTVVRGEPLVMVKGEVQYRDGTLSVLAYNVEPLRHFVRHASRFFSFVSEKHTPASHDFQ